MKGCVEEGRLRASGVGEGLGGEKGQVSVNLDVPPCVQGLEESAG